jgi:prepilin-type N-terminal cleavage/methylation domain-containing protein
MNQRGFTLVEVLVAAAALGIVLFGAAGMFLVAGRVEQENSAQIFLQRQATMIKDEMARQIQEGSLATLTTCPGVADSVQITNSRDTYCFRGGNDASGNPTIFKDRLGGGTANLLEGSAATLSVAPGFSCPGTAGFCPTVIQDAAVPPKNAAVRIVFRLRYRFPESNAFQTMTFTTTIAPRNP